jgi:LPXTG-site transpeptidase (sortase) family protein
MVYEITSSDDASRSGTIERAPAVELEIAPPVEEPVLQEVFEAPVQALWIPALRINAPLVPMGVRRDGYMDLPYNPYQVAWYYFTGKPGMGGNAVFSAHVDYINYGPAVFWGLSRLRPGDDVAITLTDGVQLNYSVVDSYVIPRGQLDINALIAPTEVETLTLITCGGTFAYNDYSHRVVVRATRISAQRA